LVSREDEGHEIEAYPRANEEGERARRARELGEWQDRSPLSVSTSSYAYIVPNLRSDFSCSRRALHSKAEIFSLLQLRRASHICAKLGPVVHPCDLPPPFPVNSLHCSLPFCFLHVRFLEYFHFHGLLQFPRTPLQTTAIRSERYRTFNVTNTPHSGTACIYISRASVHWSRPALDLRTELFSVYQDTQGLHEASQRLS
jgi:hypothetical protein